MTVELLVGAMLAVAPPEEALAAIRKAKVVARELVPE
jgi:hypothetical protein